MEENQIRQDNLIDTTDCLEAVGVFRCWKNFLFAVCLICLIVLQAAFWLARYGCIETGKSEPDKQAAVMPASDQPEPVMVDEDAQISQAARKVTADADSPVIEAATPSPDTGPAFTIKYEHLAIVIRLADFVLIISAILYCATLLFCLKISLLGRIGGISHIARAFFLSLTFLVLLLPWQKFFGPLVSGAIYTAAELRPYCDAKTWEGTTFRPYLRFAVYWLAVVWFLIWAQLKSGRWARTILRRLEVI